LFKLSLKFLQICSIVSLFLFLGAGASFAQPPDILGHWAEKQINGWIDKGFARGYPDGSFKPDYSITRAEFITLVNKSFGLTGNAPAHFTDASSTDWFFKDVCSAMAAGYISGYEDGTLRPDNEISRQEVAVILSRLLKLKIPENANAVSRLKDLASIPQWSRGPVNAVVANGYMAGYPDQTYQPEKFITRAEAIVTLERAAGEATKAASFDQAGTYGPEQGINTIDGNVVVSAAGVTLQNTAINGRLALTEDIGEGNVSLKNVTVKGSTTIKGGGTSSITLEDCTLGTVTVNKSNGNVRVVALGNTSVGEVELDSGAGLEESGLTGNGFGGITIAGIAPANAVIVLKGNFQSVEIASPKITVQLASGSVAGLIVGEDAAGATVNVAGGAEVSTLTLNAAATVTGQGTVETARVHADGVTMQQSPGNILVANGITATIANKVVTQSMSAGSQASGGGGSPGSDNSDNSAPLITAATITVGGQTRNVAISDGRNGSVDLSGLDEALPITGGTINVSKMSTLRLIVENIPLTQKLSAGNNQLEVLSILSQFGSKGMNLDNFRQLFGNPVVLRGTLTDGSGNSSAVSLTITLP